MTKWSKEEYNYANILIYLFYSGRLPASIVSKVQDKTMLCFVAECIGCKKFRIVKKFTQSKYYSGKSRYQHIGETSSVDLVTYNLASQNYTMFLNKSQESQVTTKQQRNKTILSTLSNDIFEYNSEMELDCMNNWWESYY